MTEYVPPCEIDPNENYKFDVKKGEEWLVMTDPIACKNCLSPEGCRDAIKKSIRDALWEDTIFVELAEVYEN